MAAASRWGIRRRFEAGQGRAVFFKCKKKNWEIQPPGNPHLSGLPLDTSTEAVEYVDCPLVVVLEWGTYSQLPEAIAIHVRKFGHC